MASKPRKTSMPTASDALPGRPQPMAVAEKHFVNGNRLAPPFPAGLELATRSKAAYQRALAAAGHGAPITSEVGPAPVFFYAEEYHQQYLAKNPDGYCGLGGTGIACPAGPGTAAGAAG